LSGILGLDPVQYELAKELEEAGFPQAGKGSWMSDPDAVIARDRVYVPTLEELIEARGTQFEELRQTPPGWVAGRSPYGRTCHGKTPVEAVARLWLALQMA
jgi:hypothetical protein